VANAIHEALTMSKEEKQARHRALFEHVTRYTSDFWADSFIKQLLATQLAPEQSNPTPFLDSGLFKNTYRDSKRRLFMLDYDVSHGLLVRLLNIAS
jgi:trehalose 6-phosphate synthase/phosphatase